MFELDNLNMCTHDKIVKHINFFAGEVKSQGIVSLNLLTEMGGWWTK